MQTQTQTDNRVAAAAAVLSEEFFLSSFVFLFCFVHERIERSHTYIVIMMMMKVILSPESEGCLCPSVSVCVQQRLKGGGEDFGNRLLIAIQVQY